MLAQSLAVNAAAVLVYQTALGEFVDNAEYSTCTSALLNAVFLRVRSQLAKARSLAAQLVNILHREVCACLLRHSEQMEHSICTSSHSDVECHCIKESITSGDVTRQNALVSILIICQRILNYLACGIAEKLYPVLVSRENSAVSGQRETDSLGQGVHRVCREHARARAAARTSTALNLCHLFIADTWVGTLHHCCDEVGILATPAASLHRTSRAEHRRDVQTHRCHQHARRHLVAVGDTNHRISLMCIHHILHRVGYDVARRQRIEHTIMSHSNSVVDGDSVKLGRIASHALNLLAHYLSNFMQMCMTWNKLRERVDHSNNWFSKLFALHSRSHP